MALASGVASSDLLDLINTTRERLPAGDFTVTQEFQKYTVMDKWFAQDRVQYRGGRKIVENAQFDDNGNAQFVRPMQRRSIHAVDTQDQFEAPWVMADTHWTITRQEILRNRGPEGFVDMVKSRRIAALMSLANKLETRCWMAPDSTSDDLNPMGLKYWIVPLDSSSAGAGFYGCHADGFTDKGGIQAATANANTPTCSGGEPMWRNYVAGGATSTTEYYLTINDAAINTMRRCMYKTHFVSPLVVDDLINGPAADYRIYCNVDTKIEYEDHVDEKNEGAGYGGDADKFAGLVAFKRVPISEEPQLEDDTTNPFYFVNHSHFYPFVQEGEYLREDETRNPDEYPDTFVTWVNLAFNFIMRNAREQAVMSVTVDNS